MGWQLSLSNRWLLLVALAALLTLTIRPLASAGLREVRGLHG